MPWLQDEPRQLIVTEEPAGSFHSMLVAMPLGEIPTKSSHMDILYKQSGFLVREFYTTLNDQRRELLSMDKICSVQYPMRKSIWALSDVAQTQDAQH